MQQFKSWLMENLVSKFITQEMEDHFIARTLTHINTVVENGLYLMNNFDLNDDKKYKFLANLNEHDKSKFLKPEKDFYVILSWKYHLKEDEFKKLNLPQWLQDDVNKASDHHLKSNKHHPEYWDKSLIRNFLDPNDRDSMFKNKIVDATEMPLVHLLEMICDWVSVSREQSSDPEQWAKENVNKRWKFTDEQVDIIYKVIAIFKDHFNL